MKSPFSSIQKKLGTSRTLPGEERLSGAVRAFSRKERMVFSLLLIVLIISTLGLLFEVSRSYMVEVPARGGSITEGVIGTPRFVNPLLANSDVDRDLTALVYSGLMRVGPGGTLIPDLAENYTVSDDGLTYTFTLRKDATWQDGTPVTADDVVFTIQKAQDPALRSPKRANWEGVTVKKVDDYTVQFVLSQAYAPFLGNTTLGIIPKHLWDNVSIDQFTFSKYNTDPVGSGPFEVAGITRDHAGIPQVYDLSPFSNFVLGRPYLNAIHFKFYPDEQHLDAALSAGAVDSANSISPDVATAFDAKGYLVEHAPLPRVYGVFFNQDHAQIFTDKAVREALNEAVDREALVKNVLDGYGVPINGPIPPGTPGYLPFNDNATSTAARITAARNILLDDGWSYASTTNTFSKKTKSGTEDLAFDISTSSVVPELKNTADVLKKTWEELGAQVTVKVFEAGTLNQNVIRPRDYDALLFGEIVGRDSDPFAFWHSSQRLDPGLNVALYANVTADKLLEDARATLDPAKRQDIYRQFVKEVASDVPAVFLYSPDFIYIVPKELGGIDIQPISIPSERFANVYQWYTKTQYIWRIFAPHREQINTISPL